MGCGRARERAPRRDSAYTDGHGSSVRIQMSSVERFIADRDYTPLPENSVVQYFSDDSTPPTVEIVYVKKPRLKVRSEPFEFEELAVKGVAARGNRVSNKEVDKVKRWRGE